MGLGTAVTLLLVNVFPARRARDILMLMGLVFATSLVILLRFIQPERLLRVESMPDVTDFFATLQSPITPLLPSFWAGEAIFASLQGGSDWLHVAALWTTAAAIVDRSGGGLRALALRRLQQVAGGAKGPLCRVARGRSRRRTAAAVHRSPRQLLVKDLKVFLRDVSQWSQLLLLVALVLVYLYNFRVLDLDRIPYMSGVIKNAYAFLNLGMAGFVMATVTVRFVFPAVSAEGAAFWIIRSAPISLRDFLWSKFWTGLIPVLVLTECLTIAGNEFLGSDPFLKQIAAASVFLMAFALVGLAAGLGARYPRFAADNPIAGRRLVRRRRLHDAGGALRDGDDRAYRLAVIGLPLRPDARAGLDRLAAVDDGAVVRHRGGDEHRHLAARDAQRCHGPRADGPHAELTAVSAAAVLRVSPARLHAHSRACVVPADSP